MKNTIIILFFIFSNIAATEAKAQSAELQQLILNLEKLNQLKSILNQMYEGYQIVSKGYNTIKDLSQGNFSLHKTFLDGLLTVSPIVKKYQRIAEILRMQALLVKQYKNAFEDFKTKKLLSVQELEYLQQVYANLLDRSLKNLEELLIVITTSQLRMNDAERLEAIDRIYKEMQNKLLFLQSFNRKVYLLNRQREHSKNETEALWELFKRK